MIRQSLLKLFALFIFSITVKAYYFSPYFDHNFTSYTSVSRVRATAGKVSRSRSRLWLWTSSSTFRAQKIDTRNSNSQKAFLKFRYSGNTSKMTKLASGTIRKQVGLKLRAKNTCNVFYVMWNKDNNKISVSAKYNPGKSKHSQCGAGGYRNITSFSLPQSEKIRVGKTSTLAANIINNSEIGIYVNGTLRKKIRANSWLRSFLKRTKGPVGIRSDNMKYLFKIKGN